MEKNNDDARRNYFSSNLQDPCVEVLKAEGRLEKTAVHKRDKRQYTKRDDEHWTEKQSQEAPPTATDKYLCRRALGLCVLLFSYCFLHEASSPVYVLNLIRIL